LLRRYQLGLARTFHRSVDTFYKAQREAKRRAEEEAEAPDETNPTAEDQAAPAPPDETNPTVPAVSPAAPSPGPRDETNPTAGAIADLRQRDETNPTAGGEAVSTPPDETKPTPTMTGPDDPAPAPDSRQSAPMTTTDGAIDAELERLEAGVEAIEQMTPLELLRALGLDLTR
jgi:hypothetical protein